MRPITMTLPEEHPLIRLGFQGRLRFQEGLEVEIVGGTGRNDGYRWLPTQKRQALELIAEGLGPADLADRLELCLERAEALYEELTMRMGLDRIAGQVRQAIRAEIAAAGLDVGRTADERTSEAGDPLPADRGSAAIWGRAMDDEELVRSLFPESEARPSPDGGWMVVTGLAADIHRLGEGRTAAEAWASAALRLEQDEWFRPIIAQLYALRSERRGGA